MRLPAPAWLLVISSTLMAACGYRGPLYLPEERARIEAEAAKEAETADEEDKVVAPQPAPQGQKRDRPSSTAPAQP